MKSVRKRGLRGQPVAMLLVVLGGWTGLRAMTWEAPEWHHSGNAVQAHGLLAGANEGAPKMEVAEQAEYGLGPAPYSTPLDFGAAFAPTPFMQQHAPVRVVVNERPITIATAAYRPREIGAGGERTMMAAGHQLMWMAALARMGMPSEVAAAVDGATAGYTGQSIPQASAPVRIAPGMAQGRRDRWSADAWMLMRKDATQNLAPGRPVYGGSQAGAVLRYHFSPSSGHRPLAYLRATQALGNIPQTEAALGLGARPIAGLPITLAGEARMFRDGDKTRFRPAAIAYSEFPPVSLPLGIRGEAYVQGGYVGGSFKTPFVDGLAKIDRRVIDVGQSELRAGGGAWGGAQKGVSRLDIGPSVTAALNLAGVPSRVAVDWRFRMLGDAEPKSGPALTVSAGF